MTGDTVGCGKAKRDPEDPTDLHVASVGPDEELRPNGPTGPAWPARDLYTSPYFGVKREFAEAVTRGTREYDADGWAVLSAEHGVVPASRDLRPYDTRIDNLGDDPSNPDHRVENAFGRRRPDGEQIDTELDAWTARVATTLCRWVAGFRDRRAKPWKNDANTLLVLAGQDYLDPLKRTGVFENGIARMTGDPNEGFGFPLDTRFLFENIDAGGMGEQMAWLSDAVDRMSDAEPQRSDAEAADLSAFE
jgi:hypothetical protein